MFLWKKKVKTTNVRNWRWKPLRDQKVAFVQIAGLVARRILTFVKEGDQLKAGERFGLIRFGSRLDVYLPKGVAPLVLEGQTAVAGETILADMAVSGPARKGEIV